MSIPSQQKARYVLQICHCYYDPFLDCARQYAALFQDSSYKVITVFLSGEADDAIAAKVNSDEVIFLGYQSQQLSGLKLKIIKEIRALATNYSFDFCIAHRAKPTYVALMGTKLPILSIHHSFGNFDRLSRRLMANLFKSRVTLIAVSNAVRDEIRERLGNWPNSKIETLYNHIDVDNVVASLLPMVEARRALNLPQENWIVGNVGRLHPDKDQKTLITAFAKALPKLPSNACLVIIGKGRLEAELKRKCQTLGISENVIFTGPVNEARRFFKAFDVFALTSDREPFGMVLLEAMAAQLPIICSDCGGGGEIVKPIGALFPFGDTNALANQLIKFANESQNQQQTFNYLNENFSDQAVRQHFWQSDFVKRFLRDIK